MIRDDSGLGYVCGDGYGYVYNSFKIRFRDRFNNYLCLIKMCVGEGGIVNEKKVVGKLKLVLFEFSLFR